MKFLAFLPHTLMLGCIHNESSENEKSNSEDWESIAKTYSVPEWFQDAKFGIYTHWEPGSTGRIPILWMQMKRHSYSYRPEFYYKHGLSKAQRERIAQENEEAINSTR